MSDRLLELYEKLKPKLGEEEAKALLEFVEARVEREAATKEDHHRTEMPLRLTSLDPPAQAGYTCLMTVTPTKLREVLGDEALKELLLLLEEKSLDSRHEILTRLDILEHDVAELKQSITDLRADFREFRREVNERFDRMTSEFNNRFDRMHEHLGSMIKWTVGTLALFGTLITILLAIGQFVK